MAHHIDVNVSMQRRPVPPAGECPSQGPVAHSRDAPADVTIVLRGIAQYARDVVRYPTTLRQLSPSLPRNHSRNASNTCGNGV
jgi:hypothetical protein